MARIILLAGVTLALAIAMPRLIEATWLTSGPVPWLWAGVVAEQAVLILTVVLGISMLGLLPDGAPHTRLERWAVVAPVALLALPILLALSSPTVFAAPWSYDVMPVLTSPLYLPALSGLYDLAITIYAATPIMALAGVGLLARRYRIADSPVRRQLRWLLYGGVLSIGAIALAVALHDIAAEVSGILWFLPAAIMAVAIAVATIQHRSAGMAAAPPSDGSRTHDVVRRLASAIVAVPRVLWARVVLDGGADAEAGSNVPGMGTTEVVLRR